MNLIFTKVKNFYKTLCFLSLKLSWYWVSPDKGDKNGKKEAFLNDSVLKINSVTKVGLNETIFRKDATCFFFINIKKLLCKAFFEFDKVNMQVQRWGSEQWLYFGEGSTVCIKVSFFETTPSDILPSLKLCGYFLNKF